MFLSRSSSFFLNKRENEFIEGDGAMKMPAEKQKESFLAGINDGATYNLA
jgi:hypothetical protein